MLAVARESAASSCVFAETQKQAEERDSFPVGKKACPDCRLLMGELEVTHWKGVPCVTGWGAYLTFPGFSVGNRNKDWGKCLLLIKSWSFGTDWEVVV